MTFEQENDHLLKVLLTERFFKPWLEPHNKDFKLQESLWSESKLELYLTSTCNQKCEYCYLINHPELYPAEYNNKELILKNLKIFLDWIIESDFIIPEIELYSGEIWHSSFGLEVLDIILESLQKRVYCEYFMIPSNVSFLRNKTQTYLIQQRIDRFKELHSLLQFSISVDGKVIEDMTRPTVNPTDTKNDDFYEAMFLFAKHNNYYFHPMVSAYSIEYWIENYKWWMSQCEKYDIYQNSALMMLEVRNDDWTKEKIEKYKEFLDYLFEEEYQKAHKNIALMADNMYNLSCRNNTQNSYVPYIFVEAATIQGCTVTDHLTVRLGDLAIAPCHRLAYNKFLYGHFTVKDGKIDDIVSNNPQMAIRILYSNHQLCTLGCDSCIYSTICLRGCYGSQYETTNDPFFVMESVCNFFKEKYNHIIQLHEQYGLIDYFKTVKPTGLRYPMVKNLLSFFEKVRMANELG